MQEAMSSHQCGRCLEKFTSLELFDKHQDVDYKRKPVIICIRPESLGMVRAHNESWTTPEGALRLAALAGRARLMREAKT
jgi:hypothetical protein